MTAPTPSKDEQQMAGFGYLGLVLCLVPTIIIYLQNKEKSKFVEFHCLQAIGFVIVALCLNLLNIIIGIVLRMIPFIGPIISGIIWLVIMAAVFIGWLVISIQTLQGKNIEFPIIADFIKKNMMKA